MRRVARENVFKLIFEYTFYGVRNDGTLELMLVDASLDDDDRDYIKNTYAGIMANRDKLDAIIAAHLDGYVLERVYRPDYAVLLVAVYEFLNNIAPPAVVVNEAVSLAKKYGVAKSGGFVNGVLAKIVNEK